MFPFIFLGASIGLGITAILVAPSLVAEAGRAARPLAKGAAKTAMLGCRRMQAAVATTVEGVSDLLAEARHEIETPQKAVADQGSAATRARAAAAAAAAARRAAANG